MISQEQIQVLREGYESIERINPTGKAYQNLQKLIKKLNDEAISILIEAKIKWVSYECEKEQKLRIA